MQKTVKLTFSAVMAALFTLTAFISSLIDNIVLLMAGSIFLCAAVIECGRGYGLVSGLSGSLLSLLLLPNKIYAFICLGFLWYYPALKSAAEEKIQKKSVCAVVKAALFAVVTIAAAAAVRVLGLIPDGVAWYYYVLLFVMLIAYDVLLGGLIDFYMEKVAPKIKRR